MKFFKFTGGNGFTGAAAFAGGACGAAACAASAVAGDITGAAGACARATAPMPAITTIILAIVFMLRTSFTINFITMRYLLKSNPALRPSH